MKHTSLSNNYKTVESSEKQFSQNAEQNTRYTTLEAERQEEHPTRSKVERTL